MSLIKKKSKMNTKTLIREEIKSLLSRRYGIEHVFYHDNIYHVIDEAEEIEITQVEAIECLKHGAEFFHLMENTKEYDHDSEQWIGEDPIHVTPPGLPRCKVVNVTTGFPINGFVDIFKKRSKHRSDYTEPIRGITIIRDCD